MLHFIRHELTKQNNENIIILYMNPNDTEFSRELGEGHNRDDQELKNAVKSYVSKNLPNVKKGTVKIMVGTMLLGTIILGAGNVDRAGAEERGIQAVETTTTLTPKDVNDFKDINDEHEFYKYVRDLAQKGYIKGIAEDTYGTYQSINRAQAAKIIALAAGYDISTLENPGFRDVVENGTDAEYAWAYPYVAALENDGVLKGYTVNGEREFRPRETVTREQMAKMLVNAFELSAEPIEEPNDPATWSDGYIQTLINTEVTTMSFENFGKTNKTTRGHLAKFVYESQIAYGTLIPHTDITTDGLIYDLGTSTLTLGVTDALKGILNPTNKDILADSEISAMFNEIDEFTELLRLRIFTGGEVGNNAVLDGGGNTVKNIQVYDNNVTLQNLSITDELEIIEANGFYANNVTVDYRTIINGEVVGAQVANTNPYIFENSSLGNLQIEGANVILEARGTTTVNKMVVASESATITGEATTIGQVVLTDAATKLTVSPGTQIQQLILPANSKASDMITNYDEVKAGIAKIGDTANPDYNENATATQPEQAATVDFDFLTGFNTIQANEEAPFTIKATATNVSQDTPVRYKAILVRNDGTPVADQTISYEVEPDQWLTFTTDENGVAYFGPEAGFTTEGIGLQDGITTAFKTTFTDADIYSLSLSLVNATTPEQTIGEVAGLDFVVSHPGSVDFSFVTGFNDFTAGVENPFSISATATQVSQDLLVRYKAIFTNEDGSPVANQTIDYEVAAGQWESFTTNEDGEAFFGPAEGFKTDDLALASGVTTNFKATIATAGTYHLKVGLVEAANTDMYVDKMGETVVTVK
ncbi:S-layer homology domain-containing protein [Bacillus sp. AK128]